MNKFKTINTMQRYVLSAVVAAMLLGLGACSGMSSQDKTAIVAGVGANGGRHGRRGRNSATQPWWHHRPQVDIDRGAMSHLTGRCVAVAHNPRSRQQV